MIGSRPRRPRMGRASRSVNLSPAGRSFRATTVKTTRCPWTGSSSTGSARRSAIGVTTPDDPGYHDARQTFNATVQRRPAAIVRVRSDDDVVAAVVAAGDLGLPIAVRGGGHSVAGHAMADGALVVDLRDLRAVSVDPATRIVRVQARCALGGRRRRGLGAPPRRRRRHVRRHGRGGSDARWRDRLAIRSGRVHLRQPAPRRARDGGRRARGGRAGWRPGPPLGAARGRRQLRRGDLVRVPRHRPGADRGRLHLVPAPCHASRSCGGWPRSRRRRRTPSSSRRPSPRSTRPASETRVRVGVCWPGDPSTARRRPASAPGRAAGA